MQCCQSGQGGTTHVPVREVTGIAASEVTAARLRSYEIEFQGYRPTSFKAIDMYVTSLPDIGLETTYGGDRRSMVQMPKGLPSLADGNPYL